MITIENFSEIDIRVGTIQSACVNEKARKPAYKLVIDLGQLGYKNSSAQLVQNYKPQELIGRQVICVVNLPPRQIASFKSEVLVLAALEKDTGTVLIKPDQAVNNGTKIA